MAAEINHFISWVLNPFQIGLVVLLLGGVWLVVRKDLMDFVPNSDTFVRNGVLFKEHFAYWCNRVKYWWRDRP